MPFSPQSDEVSEGNMQDILPWLLSRPDTWTSVNDDLADTWLAGYARENTKNGNLSEKQLLRLGKVATAKGKLDIAEYFKKLAACKKAATPSIPLYSPSSSQAATSTRAASDQPLVA